MKIECKSVLSSKDSRGITIHTVIVTMPRFLLSELNTHRLFSRNSASSRAIPFKKMLESVITNPFIPIAFQKDHSGMQGTEYFSNDELFELDDNLISILEKAFNTKQGEEIDKQVINLIKFVLGKYKDKKYTLKNWWLICRDSAVESACLMSILGITKQLANRLLEPFMWHTVLITATEWENFFNLRCPQYPMSNWIDGDNRVFKSRKQVLANLDYEPIDSDTDLYWLLNNKGQAEIHMMLLAEAIYDCINEAKVNQLKEGEWHIPFIEDLEAQSNWNKEYLTSRIKISSARNARTSYTPVGDNKEFSIENDLKLHYVLSTNGHWSPFEHIARSMTDYEYRHFVKGEQLSNLMFSESEKGWCNNFKGFIQYRYLLENKQEL